MNPRGRDPLTDIGQEPKNSTLPGRAAAGLGALSRHPYDRMSVWNKRGRIAAGKYAGLAARHGRSLRGTLHGNRGRKSTFAHGFSVGPGAHCTAWGAEQELSDEY